LPKIDFGEQSTPGNEKFPSGGLKLNLTFDSQDLEKYDTIVLYAVNVDIASVPEQNRVIEDTDQIIKVEEYSKTYQLALQPAFQ
jgi:hypothetical protein